MRKIRADLTAYGRGRRSKHISSIFVTHSGEAVVIPGSDTLVLNKGIKCSCSTNGGSYGSDTLVLNKGIKCLEIYIFVLEPWYSTRASKI